jgi:tetratricopeptide (TPR) repeat protein
MNDDFPKMIFNIVQLIRESKLLENKKLILEALDDVNVDKASIFKIGIGCAQSNKLNEALLIFESLHQVSPDDIRVSFNLGLTYSLLGNHQKAIQAYDNALRINPFDLDTLINKGSSCNDIKNYHLALEVLEAAIEMNSEVPEAWSNKGVALNNLKMYEEAMNAFNKAIHLNTGFYEAWSNKGLILYELKRYDEALAHFERALSLVRDDPKTLFHIGICLFKLKRYDEALVKYEKAISLKSDYAEALSNKGLIYAHRMQFDLALTFHEQALKLNPHLESSVVGTLECYFGMGLYSRAIEFSSINFDFVKDSEAASQLLALIQLSLGNKEEAYKWLVRSFEIKQTSQADIFNNEDISPSRIKHEFEQLTYLNNKKYLSQEGEEALIICKDALMRPSKDPYSEQTHTLRKTLDACYYFPDLPFPSNVLGNNDYKKIEDQYLNSDLKLVVIDNFLDEEALLNLRQFVYEANVWKASYPNGYVGCFMESGFCSRAVLSISEELKKVLPRVIGENRLTQAWAFKYDQRMKGINLHADYAKVNVNFWITPDEACLDKNSGGMVIYDVPVPSSWSFEDYNTNPQKLKEYLDSNASRAVKVPYKSNRCVLFDSAYIHNTDDLHFESGYENRRVNCTLLYGKQLNL